MPATAIPTQAITDSRLEATALRVLAYLCEYRGEGNTSLNAITVTLRMSKSTVQRALRALETGGYLVVQIEPGKPARYSISYDRTVVTKVPHCGHESTGTVVTTVPHCGHESTGKEETTDVSYIYNTSLDSSCINDKDLKAKTNTTAAAAASAAGILVTTPSDIQNAKLVEEAKAFIEHAGEENYLSTIRRWQAIYGPVLKAVLEEIVTIRQHKPVHYWTKRLEARKSEMLSQPPRKQEEKQSAEQAEMGRRDKQIAQMRSDGATDEQIKEYLIRREQIYPIKSEQARGRKQEVA